LNTGPTQDLISDMYALDGAFILLIEGCVLQVEHQKVVKIKDGLEKEITNTKQKDKAQKEEISDLKRKLKSMEDELKAC
jgi:hypothetical protein